jgi:hypothetical protein
MCCWLVKASVLCLSRCAASAPVVRGRRDVVGSCVVSSCGLRVYVQGGAVLVERIA